MTNYTRFTVKHAFGLASPHTWPASIFPVLLGAALAVAWDGSFSWPVFVLLTMASALLHASVNTINDYYDFIKGNDLIENSDDPNDAVLVYNNIDPKQVKRLGSCYLAAAILLGLYPVYRGGLVTLAIGLCGCFIVVAYSAGRRPISYLPLGEVVSGIAMGGLITVAVFSAFTGYAQWAIFLLATPLVLGIGLIMMTNNICDIERDAPIGRRTLPVLLGRATARTCYLCCVGLWPVLMLSCTAICFSGGLPLIFLCMLASFPIWRRLARSPLTPEQRGPSMRAILLANLCANTAYVAAILVHVYKG